MLIEFYTSSTPITITMFVKRIGIASLLETFDKAVKVEKEMISLKGNKKKRRK